MDSFCSGIYRSQCRWSVANQEIRRNTHANNLRHRRFCRRARSFGLAIHAQFIRSPHQHRHMLHFNRYLLLFSESILDLRNPTEHKHLSRARHYGSRRDNASRCVSIFHLSSNAYNKTNNWTCPSNDRSCMHDLKIHNHSGGWSTILSATNLSYRFWPTTLLALSSDILSV